MIVKSFHDPKTGTVTHVVHDAVTHDAVVIDPVLDFDPLDNRIATTHVEAVADYAREAQLHVRWVLETALHVDHLSGAHYLARRFGPQIAIGRGVADVRRRARSFADPGYIGDEPFDRVVVDGDVLHAGHLSVEVLETPGPSPASVCYRISTAVFVGGLLLMEDRGTGRCDVLGGDAHALYRSVQTRLYTLPDMTRVFVGHDVPGERGARWETTIGRARSANVELCDETREAEFVAKKVAADRHLPPPTLAYPSIEVNLAAGRLPSAAPDGHRYVKVPLDRAQRIDADGAPAHRPGGHHG